MKGAIPLAAFIRSYFKDPADFANVHGCKRNTVYRMQARGVYVTGNREKYTIWTPSEPKGDQPDLF
ncbi:MAG: hypothetical protein CMJ20_01815 [Phycisphaeraceae bacterium]|nr:hypothetical protein [Phycisphaeraceae bacterium]|tara:strand:- start:8061 stop:8258 length:198 start_codon:yes stop_codon:yes gene_type:complete